jgi:hypothetical protein
MERGYFATTGMSVGADGTPTATVSSFLVLSIFEG